MTAPATARLRLTHVMALLGLAWLVIVVQLLADHWTETARTLSDMDDAMRLVQVRAFMAGRGWFDLHEIRLGPPDGYDTHWSRLIDAGLAGLFWVFNHFADAAFSERLMRTLWPMLWLIPAMAGVTMIAWRVAGRGAAPIALLLTVVGLPAFQHFIPGRIDHHNVQIALSVLLVAATAWSDRVSWAAVATGVLTGLAMAIGFEGLPYILLAGAAMTLRFICEPEGAGPLARYGLATAPSAAVAFGVSVGPAHWDVTACDAIAVNSVIPVIIAATGLAVVALGLRGATWPARAAAAVVVALVASAVFIAIEPRCLGGPFAMMDPAVRALWFIHVSEMQSLWMVTKTSAPMGAAIAAFPMVALVCMLAAARDSAMRRNFGLLVASAGLVVAVVVMFAMVRAFSYAMWLAIPLVAAGVVRVTESLRVGTVVARAMVALFLTPAVTSGAALAAVQAVTHQAIDANGSRSACLLTENYRRLAELSPGLVATDIDYGPFVLALTPHAVLSAPYHRLVDPIIAANQIFALPPEAAHAVVSRVRPDYLVVCGRHTLGGIGADERTASLWGRLSAGEVPQWLEVVEETRQEPLVVYRVKR